MSNTLDYKGFQLDILLQFTKQVGPNTHFNTGNGLPAGQFSIFGGGNQPRTVLDRWQKPGDVTAIQRYSADGRLTSSLFNVLTSDAAFSDASFIRFKNISISWQFPKHLLDKYHIQNMRFLSNLQNVLTISKYSGIDPETLSSILSFSAPTSKNCDGWRSD